MADSLARIATLSSGKPASQVWYVGHWGFQYQAEREGLRPVVPGSSLRAGDWLLVPLGVDRQRIGGFASRDLARVALVQRVSPSPWSALPSFYAGPVALRSQPLAQVAVVIARVRHAFTASTHAFPLDADPVTDPIGR